MRFQLHRAFQLVHGVNLHLLVVALASSLDADADVHKSLESNGLVHENLDWLLHINVRHLNPRLRRMVDLLANSHLLLLQHNHIGFFVQLNLFTTY